MNKHTDMDKVLVTKHYLQDIASAIRNKTGSTEKMSLSDMPLKISNISGASSTDDFWDKYFEEKLKIQGGRIVSNSKTLRPSILSNIPSVDNNLSEIVFTELTEIKADCGGVENDTGRKITVVFKKPVKIQDDAFEFAHNVTYRFEGGITSMSTNCMYDCQKVTLEIAGPTPSGKPWGGVARQITVKSI